MTPDDNKLLSALLLYGSLLPGSAEERKAMETAGRLLLDKFDKLPDPLNDCDWVCFMLGNLLLDGNLTVKPTKISARDRRALELAQSVLLEFNKPGDFESAVNAAAAKHKVARATVTRAYKKYRNLYGDKERTAAVFRHDRTLLNEGPPSSPRAHALKMIKAISARLTALRIG